ncbi:MAG: ribonuclease PH [Candidatus Cloacimonetes bacterium]|nr:ribonuclease PH [Candidatus Cloacimonadota bacterium]
MKMREFRVTRNYLDYPPGSALLEMGNTRVICTAFYEEGIPAFLQNSMVAEGWLTAEYNMIPAATLTRGKRERLSGRSFEIQRLIGRALRAVVDRNEFPGYTVYVDCDVIQADGGTRTAAINGSCIAIYDAFQKMIAAGLITTNPLREWVAAISVGIVENELILDLSYDQDSRAQVDMNVVMTEQGKFVEIQGTAEREPFTDNDLQKMLMKAKQAIAKIIYLQKKSVDLI